ncbi:hypothetical protein DOTSEDRAFT_46119 [Dothistroma septosporum NZE10]|uniref:Uncharacterized protein n=1 Tax=Dothistroma septosporum (strain NZE10 / CBS 128990) TaxID=675120 RepID=N1PJP8_DOTSN|nr:hypothetical protein DOTSEDRAFT_46119 [Dothistroma septosporum NZE10]
MRYHDWNILTSGDGFETGLVRALRMHADFGHNAQGGAHVSNTAGIFAGQGTEHSVHSPMVSCVSATKWHSSITAYDT